jgi:serine protease inhibitor
MAFDRRVSKPRRNQQVPKPVVQVSEETMKQIGTVQNEFGFHAFEKIAADEQGNLFFSPVVDVNETGTEAAAATAPGNINSLTSIPWCVTSNPLSKPPRGRRVLARPHHQGERRSGGSQDSQRGQARRVGQERSRRRWSL